MVKAADWMFSHNGTRRSNTKSPQRLENPQAASPCFKLSARLLVASQNTFFSLVAESDSQLVETPQLLSLTLGIYLSVGQENSGLQYLLWCLLSLEYIYQDQGMGSRGAPFGRLPELI